MNSTVSLPEIEEDEMPARPELRVFDGPAQREKFRTRQKLPTLKRILLADDDNAVCEMLRRVLEFEHYEVTIAKTGAEAAARFATGHPDLVLLDLNMPGLDGWKAFSMMAKRDPMVPVIVITARPGQYATAVQLGIDALMEKPLDFILLLAAVEELLGETELERTRRLTDPEFKTKYLNPPSRGHSIRDLL
jgi:DNA-binding response OmpR family regulator